MNNTASEEKKTQVELKLQSNPQKKLSAAPFVD